MKEIKLVGVVLIVLGSLLALVGYMFKIMHWPDMFKGIISGPIIILIGMTLVVVKSFKR